MPEKFIAGEIRQRREPAVTQNRMPDGGNEPGPFEPKVANPARVWNYWVGGKDNFAADREAAELVLQLLPHMMLLAQLTRGFLIDTVHQLTADNGIRQFLDIGTGLPTADNTHEVAQRVAPESRIVYVDNDPVVIEHAQALLTGTPDGVTDYVDADLRDPATILARAARVLDFGQPVAVLLIGVLHFIAESDDPYGLVARLMDAVPSGSYLVIVHGASDIQAEAVAQSTRLYNEMSSVPYTPRSREQVARFFDGLDLVDPGLVPIGQRPLPGQPRDTAVSGPADGGTSYCGIGKKR
jgi:O-methyltransferase involved in polyketide biosynthesis